MAESLTSPSISKSAGFGGSVRSTSRCACRRGPRPARLEARGRVLANYGSGWWVSLFPLREAAVRWAARREGWMPCSSMRASVMPPRSGAHPARSHTRAASPTTTRSPADSSQVVMPLTGHPFDMVVSHFVGRERLTPAACSEAAAATGTPRCPDKLASSQGGPVGYDRVVAPESCFVSSGTGPP